MMGSPLLPQGYWCSGMENVCGECMSKPSDIERRLVADTCDIERSILNSVIVARPKDTDAIDTKRSAEGRNKIEGSMLPKFEE